VEEIGGAICKVTFEQIDKRAEELFRECGGLPIEWGAVDECVRNHYRIMAKWEISTPPDDSTRSIPPADTSVQGRSQSTEPEARSPAPKG
jgi:hypothetical protein